MKKLFLSFMCLMSGIAAYAAVGDDLTNQYLKNADFSQDTPVVGRICTYDYDMSKGGYLLFGQQAVIGWTASHPSDNIEIPDREDGANARAAGVFAIGGFDEEGYDLAELGGEYYAPDIDSYGNYATGSALGMVAVWGAKVQYTQNVTLPAGAYTIQVPVYNVGGTSGVTSNLCGFIADDGTSYVVDRKSWSMNYEWEMDEVTFLLEEETTGVISLGYTSNGSAGSKSMPHLFFDYIKIVEADAAAIIKARIDAVKENQLLPLIEAGLELGADVSASQAVYDNPAATMDEVLKAIENQKELNSGQMTDFTDYFINNAHFVNGTPLDNGVCTYARDMESNGTIYSGMQPIPYWTPNAPNTDAVASGLFAVGSDDTIWLGSKGKGFVAPATKADGATEGNVFGFVSCWGATAYYYQNVTLPAGSYTITIPTYNSIGGTNAIQKNLCGFIADDGMEYLGETTVFPVNIWTRETIKFTLDAETSGKISIGYTADPNCGSGSMPHLFIDEFVLTFNGLIDIDPSLIALRGAVNNANNCLFSQEPYEFELVSQLKEAVEAGQTLIDAASEDVEANLSATNNINNVITEISISRDKYAKFKTFLDEKMAETIESLAKSEDMTSFAEELGADYSDYQLYYDTGELATEQIDEIIGGFDTRVDTAVQNAFDAAVAAGDGGHDIDITRLINKNLSFANKSTSGWTVQQSSGKFESQQVGVVEIWSNNPITFTATITTDSLPAGLYQIQTPGFYRNGSITANYEAYATGMDAPVAYLIANGNREKMHNQAEMAVDEQDDLHNATVGDVYLPNGQSAAQTIFYGDTEYDMTNTIITALFQDGPLQLGTTATGLEEGGSWVCWGAFTVTYLGQDTNLALQSANGQIQSLIEDASSLGLNDYVQLIDKSSLGISQAIGLAEEALATSSLDQKLSAIDALNSAIEYAQGSEAALVKWIDIRSLYELLQAEVTENPEFQSSDEQLNSLLGRDPEEGAVSIEEIESVIESFPEAWSSFIFGQDKISAASEDNPIDVSAVILNPSFENLDEDGIGLRVWNVEKKDGDTGIRSNENATYTITGCDGNYLFNTWNQPEVGYAIDQDVCLPAGYYVLKCVVASIADKVIRLHAGEEAYSELTFTDSLDAEGNTIASKTIGRDLSVVFGSKGETMNLGLSTVNAWYKADNFRLMYLGTKVPTDISEVVVEPTLINTGIYDLSGRKVSKAQRGLYIINGKKILLK